MEKLFKPLTFENKDMLLHVLLKKLNNAVNNTTKNIIGSWFSFFFIVLICTTLPQNGLANDANDFLFTSNKNEVRIDGYVGSDTMVEIPQKVVLKDGSKEKEYIVTSIGDKAFQYKNVVSVIIPNTVVSIGSRAFYHCQDLISISIPNSVTTIGSYAFKDCISLNDIQLSNLLKKLDSYLFDNCSSLTHIDIPKSVVSISTGAFENCSNLTSLIIPESVKEIDIGIGGTLFGGCEKLKSIHFLCKDYRLNTNYSSLGFKHCPNLESVFIESFPSNYYGSFFEKSDYLKVVELGSGVNTIRNFTFEGCSNLTTVIIKGSVTSIGSWAFKECSNLTNINLSSGLKTINMCAFSDCSKLEHINLPNTLDSIGKGTFENCSSLQSIIIPNSVKSIGEYAFSGCNNLSYVKLPSRLNKIEKSLFRNCWSLNSIIIPKTVTTIGDFAFSCCGLMKITIPNSVKSIGDLAFSYTPINTITIPQSVESIGSGAFSHCIYLNQYFCHIKQPLSESGLTGKYPNLIIYVPYESIDLYRKHNEWKNYVLFPQMALIPKKGYDIMDNWNPDIRITGVTADGKSKLYASQLLELLPEKTDLEDVEIKIYYDGEECTDETITGKFSKIGLSEDQSGTCGFSYTAPEDFPEGIKDNDYLLDIYLTTNIEGLETLVGAVQIKVMRPGVLLVHGLNSDASCFASIEKYLTSDGGYKYYQIKNVNYFASNKAKFDVNTKDNEVIKNNAKILFRQLADAGIISSSYDMIGHSMGGILIRKYAQEVDEKSVNKIITINTPHSGSPWADEYVKMVSRVDDKLKDTEGLIDEIWCLFRLFADYQKAYGNWGAIDDLSTSSEAIEELNSPKALEKVKGIPVVALYSSLNMENAVPQKIISINPKYSWLYDTFTTGTFLEKDKDGKINDVEILNRLFAKEKHDGVVPLNSQRGGITGRDLSPKGDEYKGAFGLSSYSHHCNITDNPETFSAIQELLCSPKNSSIFAKGFNPIDLSNKNARTRASNEKVTFKKPSESQFIKIMAEKEDTVRVLKVMVSGSKDLWTNLVFMGFSEGSMLTGIGQNEYRFRIPDTYEGDLIVYALGRTEDDALVGDSLVVNYEKGASLTYMYFEDWPSVTMTEGQQLEFNVLAGWTNGEEKYITPNYSTDKSGIIDIEGALITAKGVGECQLFAQYGDLSDTLNVKVIPAIPSNIQTVRVDKPTVKYYNGILTVIANKAVSGNLSVEIYDLSGRPYLRKHQNVSLKEGERAAFDLSSLPSQLYIVKVSGAVDATLKFYKR